MPHLWAEDLTQIINACMKTTTLERECFCCYSGRVRTTLQSDGHATIYTSEPCSNASCPSHLPSKEETELKEALATLTPKQRVAYFMLNETIDALYEAGVFDVSYFPHQAKIILINAAKGIAVAMECADNAII